MNKDLHYGWTQPVCTDCWNERNPDRQAARLVEGDRERCCHCDRITRSGIYVRVDPESVPYPTPDEED